MKHTGKVQGAIAFLILFGFFGVLAALILLPMSGAMNEALLIMTGALGTMAGGVVSYYFGSSSGSARKDEIMASQMPTDSITVRHSTTTAAGHLGGIEQEPKAS